MPHDHVLVVEDDDLVRNLVKQLLEQRALHVTSARDGVDALHQLNTKRYALVILDLMMPHMSGIDLLDSLNVLLFDPTLRSLKHVPPVLVVTSAPHETIPDGELERRFPKIVRGVLRKPIEVEELTKRIDALLLR